MIIFLYTFLFLLPLSLSYALHSLSLLCFAIAHEFHFMLYQIDKACIGLSFFIASPTLPLFLFYSIVNLEKFQELPEGKMGHFYHL